MATESSRKDPQRRDRIIGATQQVTADFGVAGTSHRRVADFAGIPLGSMTYHFSDREELLAEAFEAFIADSAAKFAAYFNSPASHDQALEAVTAILVGSSESVDDALKLGAELYPLGARHQRFQTILRRWIRQCREVMARYFDAETTLLIDALYEGLLLHRAMDIGEHSPELLKAAIARLAPPETYIGPIEN